MKGAEKRSKYSKVLSGSKFCKPCNTTHPLEEFPPGSSACHNKRKAMQNIKNSAIAQGKLEWWDEVQSDATLLKKVTDNYLVRCPEPEKGSKAKRKQFPIIQYIEELRQEQQILLDSVYEMMCERQFIAWMAKSKNGSMDPLEAAALFKTKCEEYGAITDKLGPTARYAQRVGVRIKDLVIHRDATIRAKIGVAS